MDEVRSSKNVENTCQDVENHGFFSNKNNPCVHNLLFIEFYTHYSFIPYPFT